MRRLILAGVLLATAGCQAALEARPTADAGAVSRGRAATCRAGDPRLDRVVGRLAAAVGGAALAPCVLASDRATAYAWPDRRIAVSRGLLGALDDDELAAAVAHEIGHLVADGHVPRARALRGHAEGLDVEARADRIGVEILAGARIPADAMTRMLERVRDASASPGLRAALAERIGRLSAAAPPPA